MYTGDETNSWNDAGPCPQCGDRDCWNGCAPDEALTPEELHGIALDDEAADARRTAADADPVARFEVGAIYATRAVTDASFWWTFTVTARTAKFITIQGHDNTRRVGVYIYDNAESARPMGNYSMAPVISANNPTNPDEVAS